MTSLEGLWLGVLRRFDRRNDGATCARNRLVVVLLLLRLGGRGGLLDLLVAQAQIAHIDWHVGLKGGVEFRGLIEGDFGEGAGFYEEGAIC